MCLQQSNVNISGLNIFKMLTFPKYSLNWEQFLVENEVGHIILQMHCCLHFIDTLDTKQLKTKFKYI